MPLKNYFHYTKFVTTIEHLIESMKIFHLLIKALY